MRNTRLILVAVSVVLAGCADGANDVATNLQPEPPVSFTSVVKDIFAATADNTDPIEVDQAPLESNDLENTAAFDDLLQ